MATYADIIRDSRVLLQDTRAPYRYTDDELLVGANDAVKLIRKGRPDVFFGKFTTPINNAQIEDTLPLGAEYEMLVRDYIVAHANLRDAEDSDGGKAATFMALFERGLVIL